MSANSSSSSSMGLRVVSVPICEHGFEADLLTSHTAKNPNRRFFCCCLRKWDDCNFFRWAQFLQPNTSCTADCSRDLQRMKDDYENQLRSRAMAESTLTEQLRLKTEELRVKNEVILVLQARLEESNEWKNWFVGLMLKIGFLVIFIIGAFLAKAVG